MANFPCIQPCTVCPTVPPGAAGLGLSPNDPNNPFNNISSEAPDVDLFISRRFTPPGLGGPPLGSTWFSIGCLGFAFSSVSQEDADLLAQQQAVLCTGYQWPLVVTPNPNVPPTPEEPPIITPRPVFFSQPASCDFTCPDGTVFTYVVPAGFFFAFSQVAANAMAVSYACNQVVANRSCFGPAPQSRVCLDALYDSSIAVASAHLPITFTIQSGSLPPGIVEAQSPSTYLLSGAPTIPGDYTFLLRATDSTGAFIEKQLSISVFGIVNTSPLPEANVGTPYSETLVTAGTPVGAVTYAIIIGALPAGLTLNSSTGEISGTPTTQESAGFSVRITDSGISCMKQFEIEVAAVSACPDWTAMAWHDFAQSDNGSGVSTMTPSGAGPTDSWDCTATAPANPGSASVSNRATVFAYSGPGCNCNFHLEVTDLTNITSIDLLTVELGDPHFSYAILANPLTLGVGVHDIPFALPDGTVTPYDVVVVMGCTTDNFDGTARSIAFSGQITNI